MAVVFSSLLPSGVTDGAGYVCRFGADAGLALKLRKGGRENGPQVGRRGDAENRLRVKKRNAGNNEQQARPGAQFDQDHFLCGSKKRRTLVG
jgi:hypothetical protein